MDYLTPKPIDPNARQHACRIPSNLEKDFRIYSPLKVMPENRPQADRELKANELRPGTDVVVMMPRFPGYETMWVMQLTDTTVLLAAMSSRRIPCRIRPDGYIEEKQGTILRVFKPLEAPRVP